ncbi:MAG: hypothetical protein N2234_05380, partial [Planctomycetota bacterium]|nr:hypothetical protein [Planctomycetota bacterium]
MRMMDSLYEIITLIGEPFSSPFYLLFLLLVILFSRKRSGFMRFLLLVLFTVVFYGVYKTVSYNKEAAVWLSRLKSPVFLVMSVVVVPALLLPRNKWYRMFLVFVVLWVVLLPLEVVHQYSRMPSDAEFSWFLARSVFVLGAVGGVFVLAAHLLSLGNLRKLVRITMFLILIYGGLALRQDHTDYKEAMSRRKESTTRVLLLAETVPVIRGDRQMIYLPSAPWRFSTDGGCVQGCPMELLQRIAQTDYG